MLSLTKKGPHFYFHLMQRAHQLPTVTRWGLGSYSPTCYGELKTWGKAKPGKQCNCTDLGIYNSYLSCSTSSRASFVYYARFYYATDIKKHTEFSRKISAVANITAASPAQRGSALALSTFAKPRQTPLPLHFEACWRSQSLRKVRAIASLSAALQPPNIRTERWRK